MISSAYSASSPYTSNIGPLIPVGQSQVDIALAIGQTAHLQPYLRLTQLAGDLGGDSPGQLVGPCAATAAATPRPARRARSAAADAALPFLTRKTRPSSVVSPT